MVSKTVFGSNHVAEQLLFSIVPSILTFDYALILGSILAILSYFRGWGRVQKQFLGLLM